MTKAAKKPELKWIPVEDLVIDLSYQRDTLGNNSKESINRMKAEFSWHLCGAITVFKTKNKYAIVDGQHRTEAARANGIEEMPCFIIDEADVTLQAKSFIGINTKRIAITSLASFKAACTAGDEKALKIKQICDECKISIPTRPVKDGRTAPRETYAIATLMKMASKYDDVEIKWVLNLIPDAYGPTEGKMRAMIIKALAEFCRLNPEVRGDARNRALFILRETDPRKLEEEARSVVKLRGGAMLKVMVEALERAFKLSANKIIKTTKQGVNDKVETFTEDEDPMLKKLKKTAGSYAD